MAAITSMALIGPPIRCGNAAGKAIVEEVYSIPASTAGDTQTLTLTYIATPIFIRGNGSLNTAFTNSEAGASVPVKTIATVAANNTSYVSIVGYARDNAPA